MPQRGQLLANVANQATGMLQTGQTQRSVSCFSKCNIQVVDKVSSDWRCQ